MLPKTSTLAIALLLGGCAIPRHYNGYDARTFISSLDPAYKKNFYNIHEPGPEACRKVAIGSKVIGNPASVWDACLEYYKPIAQAQEESRARARLESEAWLAQQEEERAEKEREPEAAMRSAGVDLYIAEYCNKIWQMPGEAYAARVGNVQSYAKKKAGVKYDHTVVVQGYSKAKDLHLYGSMFEVSTDYCRFITLYPGSAIGGYDL